MWEDDIETFRQRWNLTARQAGLCKATAEHLKALQDGGRNTSANIAAACHACNQARHLRGKSLDPTAFADHVARRIKAGKWHRTRWR